MKTRAFTLVELIVVITILAILWTIAFISLSWYSKEARDAKRAIDTSSLLGKINIEQTRWTPISDLITETDNVYLQILWKSGSLVKTFWEADFKNLKENEKNFRDPSNKNQNYPLAYAIWWTWKDAYKFIQIATISERENKAVIKWNYYRSEDPKDAKSLFLTWWTTQEDWKELENWWEILPYPFDKSQSFLCMEIPKNSKLFNADNLKTYIRSQNINKDEPCYFECNEWYNWDWTSCILKSIWNIDVWVDDETWFIWQANPIWTGVWARNVSYPEPEWDSVEKKYIYKLWTKREYPAFQACEKLGNWWRLPTKNELATLIDYSNVKTSWPYSIHPSITSNTYWSSTNTDINSKVEAWNVQFEYGFINYLNKWDSYSILCINDSSPKLNNWIDNPNTDAITRFWYIITDYWTESYKDSYLWGKHWEAKPSWSGKLLEAKEYCSNLWDKKWRLPNIRELTSLVTYKPNNWIYSNHPWIVSSKKYWSSTSYVRDIDNKSWTISSYNGYVYPNLNWDTHNIICIHD